MKWLPLAFLGFLLAKLPAADIVVRKADELRAAVVKLQSGDVMKIAPGTYPGGHHVQGLENLTIEALDETKPPRFEGGKGGWQFSRCPGLVLRHLHVSGQSGNGINLDDGGAGDLVKDIRLEKLHVTDIGPTGNHDAIKASGLAGLEVRECIIAGWGGQGLDLVGCHDSLITGCHFIGKAGFSASAGVQIKGGSSRVIVEKCRFDNAGERPVNIGGSTGLPFFRPLGAKYEAKDIVVRGNVIQGSLCAAAFVGVDGAVFDDNTVLFPGRWIFRILQETREDGFVPARNGIIRNNRIVFRRGDIREDINVSAGTAPDTFRIEGNRWFAEDRPEASKPRLPVVETGASHGVDPRE